MLQLKVFYNISFPDGERCEAIFTDEVISTFEDLLRIVREKIECFQFIPDTEVRAQYYDDEDTLINLRPGDLLNDALRCAKNVTGARFSRLKLRLTWQPKSTPEMVSVKRREMDTSNSGETRGTSKKRLAFMDKPQYSSSISTASAYPQHNTHSSLPGIDVYKTSQSPPRKKSILDPSTSTSKPGNESAVNFVLPQNYMSPLDLLIKDKEREVSEETIRVEEMKNELQSKLAEYGKQSGIDYSKPACTNCHRRERHNRANCPYRGHPCTSARFCGDLNKHKDEKDIVSVATNELNAAKRNLEKLQVGLAMKVALKNQTTNSFSSVMRSKLINECTERYITSQGHGNWRQINMDLKKLESYFKGKIPDSSVSLMNALNEYDKMSQFKAHPQSSITGNPVRTLWELKGIQWPTQSPDLQVQSTESSPTDEDAMTESSRLVSDNENSWA